MSSSKDKKQAESGITGAGQGITKATEMTPEERAQYFSSFDIGKLLEQIFKYQQGIGQAPQGYQTGEQQYQNQGPLAQGYYGQTLKGVQDPYGAYESQLQPSLQLAQDYINRGAQQRGLLRSGIPIEQMGRAGVDLAIKEAQDRMAFRSQELSRGGQLSQYTQNLGQTNLANLGNLYGQQQTYGISRMGQQGQGAAQAAGYYAYPGQAQLGDYYGQRAAMYALPGQYIGAVGQAMGAAAGTAAAGCWVANEIYDGWDKEGTILARYYILNIASNWLRNFYIKYGKNIAKFIHNKPIFKLMLRPIFDYFGYVTKNGEVKNVK